ncbi:hypothetical protein SAMN05216188_10372 [Lentzea xinjiangensis]|uniref:PH domain-containing protein n=1 Tax=Lentzea xinjiangensis TaxID=402600 RepID=A0A1H9G471_9PSEU|nr:hypothetical protein [Lentzea xinjiangensis]SEQ44897.1 hypothetical protein SAMN05216188_10372 [Lentzea xinjiangensis]
MIRAMDVQRWQAAAVPWWVTKVGLVGGWIVAFYFAASGGEAPCTTAHPCVPDPLFALAVVPLLATPLLLAFGRVLTGCGMGVLFGVLDVALDGSATANVAFGLHAGACAAVAAWTLRSRADQHDAAGTTLVSLPDVPPQRGVLRMVAVLLVLFGFLTFVQYDLTSGEIEQHEARASRVEAEVVEIKNTYEVWVELPDRQRAGFEPLAPESYQVGDAVPVLADGDWVRMANEPEDVTWWLTLGGAAVFLAVMLAARERRRRALWSGPVKAVRLQAVPVGARRVLLRHNGENIATVATLADLGLEEPLYHDTEQFGRVWRGEEDPPVRLDPPEVLVAGEWHHGGQVAVLVEGEVVATSTLSRVRSRHTVHSAHLPGEPVTAGTPVDLPHAVWPGDRRRTEGVLLLFAAAGALIAMKHYPDLFVLGFIGVQCVLSAVTRFQPMLRLDHRSVVLYTGVWTYRVPWAQVHGVRRSGPQLMIAFGPHGDVLTTPHLPDRQAGEKVMWARARSLLAEQPGERVTRKLNVSVFAGLAYVGLVLFT